LEPKDFCALARPSLNPLKGHIKPQSNGPQNGDWYTGRWWVGCYIWYSEEGPRRAPGYGPAQSGQSPLPCIKCNSQCSIFILFLYVAL